MENSQENDLWSWVWFNFSPADELSESATMSAFLEVLKRYSEHLGYHQTSTIILPLHFGMGVFSNTLSYKWRCHLALLVNKHQRQSSLCIHLMLVQSNTMGNMFDHSHLIFPKPKHQGVVSLLISEWHMQHGTSKKSIKN